MSARRARGPIVIDTDRLGHALSRRHHDADRWVAATALRLGIPLVFNDGIFENVPGLTLESVTVP